MQDYFNLGGYEFPVTTDSREAQIWFDRGLAWVYGFNHDEAAACFRKAADSDPDCAMAYWGEAYACGPFYNMTWEHFSEHETIEATGVCYRAAQSALAHADPASCLEQSLIAALARRYQKDHPVGLEEFTAWNDAYADAMRDVYTRFPDHLDVIALTAEALVTRTPWMLWNVATGVPAQDTDTLEAIAILESGLRIIEERGEIQHMGMLHIYLHALEMSPTPEKALWAADALYDLSPDNAHLQHMPAHIYVLCGRYADAIKVSDTAITADDKYVEHAGPYNFNAVNRGHDLLMKIHAGMLAGRLEPTIQAVNQLIDRLPEDLLRIDKPYLAILLEGYLSATEHVPVRFGRWQSIIDSETRTDPVLYPTTIAMSRYARGIAYSATGQIEAAQQERSLFLEALALISPERIMGNNPTVDVLAVGEQMLDGELNYRQRNYDVAFDHLREAVRRNDNLNFSEPWPWMHPPRHALGALLMEQGQFEEAEQVYRADLGLDNSIPRCQQHPDNVWSLHGYVECLKHRGNRLELTTMEPLLARALGVADIPINASCCCRTEVRCG
ncbi:MAG: hypothetical protein OEQ39_14125 [Gammaproteobacteria bacterium]|nr:hypothetical protein [Gammaproteobacteria bacterium]MDH3468175.1 hypothetical protein [Gammaproteobacteria bacterium]